MEANLDSMFLISSRPFVLTLIASLKRANKCRLLLRLLTRENATYVIPGQKVTECSVSIEDKNTCPPPCISPNPVLFNVLLNCFAYIRKLFNYSASSYRDFVGVDPQLLFLVSS